MHFMHPVALVPLVELAKGMHTSHATFETTLGLCAHLGKNVCVSQDRPVRVGLGVAAEGRDSRLRAVLLRSGELREAPPSASRCSLHIHRSCARRVSSSTAS